MIERLGSYDITDMVTAKPQQRRKKRWRRVQQWQIDYVSEHRDMRPRSRLAGATGLPKASLYRLLKELDANNPRLGRRNVIADKIVAEHYLDMKQRDMARLAGVSPSCITRVLRRLGLFDDPERLAMVRRQRVAVMLEALKGNMRWRKEHRQTVGNRRRFLMRREYERVASGQPQRTSLRLRPLWLTARSQRALHGLCVRWGYGWDGKSKELTYTPGMRRSPNEARFEKRIGVKFTESK